MDWWPNLYSYSVRFFGFGCCTAHKASNNDDDDDGDDGDDVEVANNNSQTKKGMMMQKHSYLADFKGKMFCQKELKAFCA